MMFNILLEDNKTIEEYIKNLESLIVKLRESDKLTNKDKQQLISIYNETIFPWMEKYYLTNKELTSKEESEMIDFILDLTSIAYKILNK